MHIEKRGTGCFPAGVGGGGGGGCEKDFITPEETHGTGRFPAGAVRKTSLLRQRILTSSSHGVRGMHAIGV